MMDKRHEYRGEMVGTSGRSPEVAALNLIYDYPVRWSPFKVLRDLIQNFYDAVQYEQWDRRFSYEVSGGRLFLRARDLGFSYDWLLHIGASTKRDDTARYAGFFGEGFKIASLCALRDHGWNIELLSRDWELMVVTSDVPVDGRSLKSLAYRIWHTNTASPDTVLCLHPFHDEGLLKSALLSFYYPSNPLFGERIWESPDTAVYFRSEVGKPAGYPCTHDDAGEGIVFAGYQALGSFQYPLIFCSHGFRFNDRERSSFFRMDVVKAIQQAVAKLPAGPSATVLQALRARWYDRPRKRYDFYSWHPMVATLVNNIAASCEHKRLWRQQQPHLLVARQVRRNDLAAYNRRRQALDWLRNSGRQCRLVQDAFLALDYPTLEDACEEDDGFSVTREPDRSEATRIHLLERLVSSLFPDLCGEVGPPPCRIIKNERAAWRGMTTCIPLRGHPAVFRGLKVRYRLSHVAIKGHLLRCDRFGNALSTYLHELAHVFGGDGSAAFGHALSLLLEIILNNSRLIGQYQEEWEVLPEGEPSE